MDLQKMQYFKDVYELNGFTKAANKNFVQQSTITQQVAAIEKELGASLLERKHGEIICTAAGEIFYQECCDILGKYEQVLKEIRKDSVNNMQAGRKLTIGFSGVMDERFTHVIQKYIQKSPELSVDFEEDRYSILQERLINEEIDIIFGTACELEKIPGTAWKTLFMEKQKVLVSQNDELARKNDLAMKEMEGQTLVVPAYDMMPGCYKKGLQLCKKMQYQIEIKFIDSFEAIKMKVASGQGITFVIDSYDAYNHKNLKKMEVRDIHFVCTLGVAYLKNNHNIVVKDFLKMLD